MVNCKNSSKSYEESGRHNFLWCHSTLCSQMRVIANHHGIASVKLTKDFVELQQLDSTHLASVHVRSRRNARSIWINKCDLNLKQREFWQEAQAAQAELCSCTSCCSQAKETERSSAVFGILAFEVFERFQRSHHHVSATCQKSFAVKNDFLEAVRWNFGSAWVDAFKPIVKVKHSSKSMWHDAHVCRFVALLLCTAEPPKGASMDLSKILGQVS